MPTNDPLAVIEKLEKAHEEGWDNVIYLAFPALLKVARAAKEAEWRFRAVFGEEHNDLSDALTELAEVEVGE